MPRIGPRWMIAGCLALSACDAAGAVGLDAADNVIEGNYAASTPQRVETETGGTVSIILPGNETTPYHWQAVPAIGIEPVTESYKSYPAPPGYTGVGGTRTFVLRVTTPGEHIVRFEERYVGPDHHVENSFDFLVVGT